MLCVSGRLQCSVLSCAVGLGNHNRFSGLETLADEDDVEEKQAQHKVWQEFKQQRAASRAATTGMANVDCAFDTL